MNRLVLESFPIILVAIGFVMTLITVWRLLARNRRRMAMQELLRSEKAQEFDARRIARAKQHYQNLNQDVKSERDPLSELFGVEVPTFCKPEKRTRKS